ncbi:MAG: hypothetical protein ABI867_31835 [Kofleriaceae bacterium]
MSATARSIFTSIPLPTQKPAARSSERLDLPSDAPLLRDPPPLVIGRMRLAPKPAAIPVTIDARLLVILDGPLATGETFAAGYARKEADLGTAFAQLTPADARALHARLATPRLGDELATKFARLTIERRTRLLTFLADARRRQALTARR